MAASHFSARQIEGLAAAIAIHDEIDLRAEAPSAIVLMYDASLLERCYWLSYHLWKGIEPKTLARLATRLARSNRLDDQDLQTFKDIRARAKQLRFAYALLGAAHSYPPHLDRLTRFMGQAQDAARCDRRGKAALRGALLRLMLTRSAVAAIDRELRGFTAASPTGFRHHVRTEIALMRKTCEGPAVTDCAFHELRKRVSRLVAFYDMMNVLDPSPHGLSTSRFLSTINGLMGAIHDGMSNRKAAHPRQYSSVARVVPDPILKRLLGLVAAFDAADACCQG
jgi:hypothetical protein